MAYISYRGVRVSPANARWSFRTSLVALCALIIALVANRINGYSDLAVHSFTSAGVLSIASIVIAVPGIVVPLFLLLVPFMIAVYGLDHDHAVWTTWWFWALTILCEILGGFALAWFGMKYGKREL